MKSLVQPRRMTIQFWILTGAIYISVVFATGYWQNPILMSLSIFPNALHTVGDYFRFHCPPLIHGQPFNAVPARELNATAMTVTGRILGGAGLSAAAAVSLGDRLRRHKLEDFR